MQTPDLIAFGARVRQLREAAAISQEEFALLCGLHRTYVGGVERGERNLGLTNVLQIARALKVEPAHLFSVVARPSVAGRTAIDVDNYIAPHAPAEFGLTPRMLASAVHYVYEVLDEVDQTLSSSGSEVLSRLIELTNLSAIVGNLFRNGIVRCSDGRFESNSPHTYPDLVDPTRDGAGVEIKVALEGNSPKGHLVKPGPHIIVRYVLAGLNGEFTRGKSSRGTTVWIWEVRCGHLTESAFNVSNTDGDSGKTAVVNAAGLAMLRLAYFDDDRCPLAKKGPRYKRYIKELSGSCA